MGWHVDTHGNIVDELGPFCLFGASLREIALRISWAWPMVVSQQVAHRPGFHNLHLADADDTRAFLNTLPSVDLELFHRCLNGIVTLLKTVSSTVRRMVMTVAHIVSALIRDFTGFGCVSISPTLELVYPMMFGS